MRLLTAANTIKKTTVKGMESQNIWQLTPSLQKTTKTTKISDNLHLQFTVWCYVMYIMKCITILW